MATKQNPNAARDAGYIKHVFALMRPHGFHPCAVLEDDRVFIEPIHFTDAGNAVLFTDFSVEFFDESAVSWETFCKRYTANEMRKFPSPYLGS